MVAVVVFVVMVVLVVVVLIVVLVVVVVGVVAVVVVVLFKIKVRNSTSSIISSIGFSLKVPLYYTNTNTFIIALGIIRHQNLYYVFDHVIGIKAFIRNPDYYLKDIRHRALQNPEYIHLLRLQRW